MGRRSISGEFTDSGLASTTSFYHASVMVNWAGLLLFLFLFLFLLGCATGEKTLVMNEEDTVYMRECGADSFLNRYAIYQCQSLEMEEGNQSVEGTPSPIHQLNPVVIDRKQKLLVIDEKIFGVHIFEPSQEVMCHRRLQVVLNPGVGAKKNYQKGWISYHPKCFHFENTPTLFNSKVKNPLVNRKQEEVHRL